MALYEYDYFKNRYNNILNYPQLNTTNDTILFDSIHIDKNIFITGNLTSDSLLVMSSLSNINNLFTYNISCNNILSIDILNDNINVNNDAYINILNCNNITSNNITTLYISNSAYINNITDNINTTSYITDTSIINNLNVVDNTNIKNDIYTDNISLTHLNIFSLANITNITTNNLLQLNNTIINNNTTCIGAIHTNFLNSDYLYTNNINITDNVTINNNVFTNNIIIDKNIFINTLFKNNTLTLNTIIFSNIKEFDNNIDAMNGKVSLFDVYRFGDLLKIRIDDVLPIGSLIGNTNLIIYEHNNYIEQGININDETYSKRYIISIEYENNNYITNPIFFNNGDIINQLDRTKIGKHIITYRIYDYENNYIDIIRSVYINTKNDIIKIILNGENEIDLGLNDKYIEQGARVYNNILYQEPVITGLVNTNIIGTYLIKYETTDNNNNDYHIYRIVNVCNKQSTISYDYTISPKAELIYTDLIFNNLLGDLYWSMECNINIQNSGTFDGIKKIMSLGIFFLGIGRNRNISNNFFVSFRGITKKINFDLSYGSDMHTSSEIYKSIIEVNKWYNIKIKRNGARLNIYINNILHEIASITSNIVEYDDKTLDISTLLINFNDEIISGLISEPKIYNGMGNLIFQLGDNYTNNINNRTLIINNNSPASTSVLYTGLDDFYNLNYAFDATPNINIIYFKNKYYIYIYKFSFADYSYHPWGCLYAYSDNRINWTTSKYFVNLYENKIGSRIINIVKTSQYLVAFIHDAHAIVGNSYDIYIYRTLDGIEWENLGPSPYTMSWPHTTIYSSNDKIFHFKQNNTISISNDYGTSWTPLYNINISLYNNIFGIMYSNNTYVIHSSQKNLYSSDLINWTQVDALKGIDLFDTNSIYYVEHHMRALSDTVINNFFILSCFLNHTKYIFIMYAHDTTPTLWTPIPIIPPDVDNIISYTNVNIEKIFLSQVYYIDNKYYLIGKTFYVYTRIINGIEERGVIISIFSGISDDLNTWIIKKNNKDLIMPSQSISDMIVNLPSNINIGVRWSELINNEIFNFNSEYIFKKGIAHLFNRKSEPKKTHNIYLIDYIIYSFEEKIPKISTYNSLTRNNLNGKLSYEDLLFYFKPNNINGFTWNDEIGNVAMNATYDSNTIYLTQNNYGWGSTTINGWKIPNNSFFQNIYWLNGLTISFWIYIKNDYIYDGGCSIIGMNKKRTSYNQTSYINGFGFSIGPPDITTNILPHTYLDYNTYNDLSQLLNTYSEFYDKSSSINDLYGKWTHFVVTTDTGYKSGSIPTELKIYKNGILFNNIQENEFISNIVDYWAKPDNASLGNFTFGHPSDAYQTDNMVDKIFYGEMMMYNRILGKYEIMDLYNYNKNNYIIEQNETRSLYDYQLLSKTLIPYYDLSQGYITHAIDLNNIKTLFNFTIEFWIYFTNEILVSNSIFKISNVFELNIGYYNDTYKYIRFTINKDDTIGNKTIYEHQSLLLENNKWHHIVLSKVNEFNFYFYINGVINKPIITTSEKFMLYKLSYINNNYNMNYIQLGSGINNIYDISQFKISSKVYQNLDTILNNYSDLPQQNYLEIDDDTIYYLEGEKDLISDRYIIFNGIVNIIDAPLGISEIILIGEKNITLFKNVDTYIEQGATIILRFRTTNDTQIKIINNVNTSINGHYINKYIYQDENIYLIEYRIIKVIDYNLSPTITLNGLEKVIVLLNNTYTDEGVTITDYTGEIILPIITGDSVLTNTIGIYNITYTAVNSFGFSSSISRIIIVKEYGDINLKMIYHTGLESFYKLSYSSLDKSEVPGTFYPRVKLIYFKNTYFLFTYNLESLKPFRLPEEGFPSYIYAYSKDRINWTPGTYFEELFPNYEDAKLFNVLTTSKYIIVFMYQGAYHIHYSRVYVYRSSDGITWDTIPSYLLSFPVMDWDLKPIDSYVYEANDVLFQISFNRGHGTWPSIRTSIDHGDTWSDGRPYGGYFPDPNIWSQFAIPEVMYNNGIYFIYKSMPADTYYLYTTDLITWSVSYVYGKYSYEIINPNDIPEEYYGSYYSSIAQPDPNNLHKFLRQITATVINEYFILTGYYYNKNNLYVVYFSYKDLEKWTAVPILVPMLDTNIYRRIRMEGIYPSKVYYINNEYHLLGKVLYQCINTNDVSSYVTVVFKAVSENLNNWIVNRVIDDVIVSLDDPNEPLYLYNNIPINCGLEWSNIINGEIFNLNSQLLTTALYYYRSWFGENNMHLSDYSIYSFNDLDNNIKYLPIYEFTGGNLYDNYWNVYDKYIGAEWIGDDIDKNIFNITHELYHGFSISMSVTYDGFGWYTENDILINTGSVGFFMFDIINSTNKCGIVVNGNNMFFYGTENNFIQLDSNIDITGTNNWLFTIKRHGLFEIYKNNILLLTDIIKFDYKLLSTKLTFGNSFDTKNAFLRNSSINNIKVWHGIIKYEETLFPIL